MPDSPIGQCPAMFDSLLLLVTAAFLLAGFVKGALGLGLPTVSMGLLAVSMPPAQAIAAVRQYVAEVQSGSFPDDAHSHA